MKNPMIGEKVAVYYGTARGVGHIRNKSSTPGTWVVQDTNGVAVTVHEKSLRRLVKKKHVECWTFDEIGEAYDFTSWPLTQENLLRVAQERKCKPTS